VGTERLGYITNNVSNGRTITVDNTVVSAVNVATSLPTAVQAT